MHREEYSVRQKGGGHSDAGDMHEIDCPNCGETVEFGAYQWWRSTCRCGEWSLTMKATLTPNSAKK